MGRYSNAEMIFEGDKLPPAKRRIIIIGYQFDWFDGKERNLGQILDSLGKAKTSLGYKWLGYPVYDIEVAKEYFKFPQNHPQLDTAYAMCEVLPDQYVVVSEFHNYLAQMKHSDFIKLCASLGAKEVYLESGEYENRNFDMNIDSNFPIELGLLGIDASVKVQNNSSKEGRLTFTFDEKNKHIIDFYTPWIATEPTWKAMIDMRKNNYAKSFKASYSYIEDFGINTNVIEKLNREKLSIGGNFSSMKKIVLKYNIIFW
jgi:hypothetical protein